MATGTGTGWTWGTWAEDQGEEEDEETEYQPSGVYTGLKDCLIFLIDCTSEMFAATFGGDNQVPFELCIKCAKSVLMNKVVSSEKDLVGIVFYGTEKHKNPSDFKHVYIYQDLDTPDAPRIKQLEEMLEGDGYNDFDATFGHSNNFSLSDVLWTCSTMLANSAYKYGHKRILLFTNNDHPHERRPDLQRQARAKAKDLAENNIDIELMHMGSNFDISKFYQDLIYEGDEEVTIAPNPVERFEELLTRVRSKEMKKRAIQKIPLTLGPGLEIGVGVYCMVREARKPSFVRLDKRTNEELKTQTKYLCEDTATELMPTDMKFYQPFGGEKVAFEKEEVAEVKKFAEPGLTLMGFKPKSRLKKHYYVKPSNFIYPDESIVNGSSRLFVALLKKCLERDVIAVCRYVPRSNTPPCFVALVPQEEELGDNNLQVSPPGFHAIYLPFGEDLRKLQLPEPSKASPDQIDKAKEIIKKLTFNFQSEAFENPVLQKHYRNLEAIALEHENEEEVTDLTLPDTDRMRNRAGDLIGQFKDMVYPVGYEPGAKVTKRKAPADGGGAAKKVKAADGPVDVEAAARGGTLNTLTVPILKEFLKSVGEKAPTKKGDLIAAINAHLGL